MKNNQVHAHEYIFSNNSAFCVPLARTEFLKRVLFHSFPLSWNNLPYHLKGISSKSLFRINLKSHLIQTCKNFKRDRLSVMFAQMSN